MKHFILFLGLIPFISFAQNRPLYNQYMLNQGLINPGYMDITTRYSASLNFRKQWMTTGATPLSFSANGHYHFTKNHGIGSVIVNDYLNGFNTLNANVNYNYHLWLGNNTALGLGVSMGFESRSLNGNYIYFDPEEATLNQRSTLGFNAGTGLSIQSQNLDFGVSLPYLFNNYLPNDAVQYSTVYAPIYSHLGYKVRFNDNFIFYPTIMARLQRGAPASLSFDGHILLSQMLWFGGGYRSDNSVQGSVGVFLEKGLRVVYTYESSFFSGHKSIHNTHEFTINYARTIDDAPFRKRQYTTRKGGKFRKKVRRRG